MYIDAGGGGESTKTNLQVVIYSVHINTNLSYKNLLTEMN